MKATRQIPRGDAWTQIVMLNTGEVVPKGIAKLAREIGPDITSGRIRRVGSWRRFVRSKRIRQSSLSGGLLHIFSCALSGEGGQTKSQCHEEQDGQGIRVVAASTQEVTVVASKFRGTEAFRTNRTGIVFNLEAVGIYPTDGAMRRNHHIAGMQIPENDTVTVQSMDGFRQVQA